MRLTGLLRVIGKYSKDYSNLPDRYIKRAMEQVYWKNPKEINYRAGVVVQRKKFKFGVNRPWTGAFRQENAPFQHAPKVFVEPIRKWSVFRGDRVEILKGKDKGKQGIVKSIIQERNWVIVDGMNTKIKELGKERGFSGIVIQEEQPLLVTSEIALVDPSDLKATPIEWRYTEDGQEVRVSTRTGRIIPMPASAEETIDYKTRSTYKEQPKDTKAEAVEEITFKPSLKTFAMEIMENNNIKEDRMPQKTYWY